MDYQDIYELVKLIPKGKVTSYGAIANALGIKNGARIIGYAMNLSHSIPNVPAHRVVNRNGLLTGRHHFATPSAMQELLESEGIVVVDNQVRDFENIFWNPSSLSTDF